MIRLVVKTQDTGKLKDVDMLGTENINLTLQVDDVRDITQRNAGYSKDFDLPATKNNNSIFEHFHDLSRYNSSFNIYKNLKAYLYHNDILIFEGMLKLLGLKDKGSEQFYNVVLFDDVANFIDTLGDATIRDLDFSDLVHERTAANMENSWTATGVTLVAGGTSTNAFYPLVQNGSISNSYSVGDLEFTGNYYFQQQCYILNLNLKYVIDKIFAFAGFEYNSTFFNTDDFKSIYFDTDIGSNVSDATGPIITASGLENLPLDIPSIYSGANSMTLNFTNESNDTDNAFNHDTSTFTAAYDCLVKITLTIPVETTLLYSNYYIASHKYDSDDNFIETAFGGSVNTGFQVNGVATFHTITLSSSVNLDAGQYIKIELQAEYEGFGDIETDEDSGNTESNISIEVTGQQPTEQIINQGVGDISLADIMSDIFTLFNLTLESQQNDVIKIETYNDFISTDIIDWTNKVDFNERVIEPIEIPRKIEFKHLLEDADYYKKKYKDANGIGYGDLNLHFDTDNKEVVEITTNVFSAPYINLVVGQFNLQTITEETDGAFEGYKNNPRLVYKRTFTGDDNFINFGYTPLDSLFSAGMNEFSQYMVNATHFSNSLATASTGNSLLFGTINTSHLPVMNGQTTDTLFGKYWRNYINERYNTTDAVLLKVRAKLTPTDIHQFTFAKFIIIENQKYRVNKIEYNTEESETSEIELFRI
tara:strand:+ start:1294 stop:3408 length:2115 start_codon:yes stop_codon:yes gene_type:complete